MKLYEFQGKELFARYGIPIPKGKVANKAEDAIGYCGSSDLPVVVKAQVLVGGRGKAGGVKVISEKEKIKETVNSIWGLDIKGYKVEKLLVEEGVEIENEIYLSIMVNRDSERFTIIACSEGGVDIEGVAKVDPGAILKMDIDPLIGLRSHHKAKLFSHLSLDNPNIKYQIGYIADKIFNMSRELYLNLVEINPLIITKGGRVLALDSKIVVDDNGIPFLKDFEKFINNDDKSPQEIEAKEKLLSFVSLDGNIGCIVNGAGLAMATMDMIKHFGGDPANFLDVGGSSNPEKVINALNIITSNDKVKVILFNIFGGITRCDDVANGIKAALKALDIGIPIVIRLTGTNEKEGVKILEDMGMETTTSMTDAVKKAVELSSKEA